MGDFLVLFATGIPLGVLRQKNVEKKELKDRQQLTAPIKACMEENQTETSGKFTNFGKHRKRNKINPARLIAAKRCASYFKFN